MHTQIQQIAARLQGLRDAMEYSIEKMAEICGIAPDIYKQYESGKTDIPMSFLCHAASKFNIEPSVLIADTEAHMDTYSVTRKGQGASIERRKAYKYQALASGFKNAKATPFEVRIEPNNEKISLNQHAGQEFNIVLEGQMLLQISDNNLILNEGDSIYFDATQPHGMKAMNNKSVRFLAIIIE